MVLGSSNLVEIVIKATDKFSATLKKAETSFEGISRGAKIAGAAMTAFGVAGAFAIKKVVTASGDFEQTKVAFTTFLKSEEKALAKLKELTDFASRTPFTIPGIEKAARQLLAVGIKADDLIPTLKSLGDVSSGLGLGEEGLQRLILNLGQVKTQGKLTGRELRDFAVAGVPLIAALADEFSVAESEITRMVSAGEIGFDAVTKAFDNMSSQGGQFFNLMDKQSKTFLGQTSNIQDSLIKIARVMGDVLMPAAKVVATGLQDMLAFFEEHPSIAKFAIVILAVSTALALIIGPILLLIGFLPALIAGFGALSAVTLPITATILAIAAAIAAVIAVIIFWKQILVGFALISLITGNSMRMAWEGFKDFWVILWAIIKNIFIVVWNSILDLLQRQVQKAINSFNSLIKVMNKIPGVNIPLIPAIDLGRFKAEVTDISKLQNKLARERLLLEQSLLHSTNAVIAGLENKLGLEEEVTKELEKQEDVIESISKEQELVNKLTGFKVIGKTGDVFNPRAFTKAEFQSDFAFEQAKRGGGTVINIENVVGLDPEEISKALSNELNSKVSL